MVVVLNRDNIVCIRTTIIILISKNLISAFLRVLNNDHHSAQELGTRSEPWWGSPMLCPISPAVGRLTRETTPSLQVSPESGITSMSTSTSTRGNLKQSFASLHPVQPSLRQPLLVPSLQFLALAIAITGDIAIAITGGPTFLLFFILHFFGFCYHR